MKLAFGWYQKAALQGYAKAQYQIGGMYYYGQGVTKNNLYSYAYLSLAFTNGYQDAIKGIDHIEKEISVEEITEAKNLATEIANQIEQNLASE